MAKITKRQADTLFNARMLVSADRDRVYAASPRTDVPFSECLALADQKTRDAYIRAADNLHEIENDLVAKGRGYRDRWGIFKPHE